MIYLLGRTCEHEQHRGRARRLGRRRRRGRGARQARRQRLHQPQGHSALCRSAPISTPTSPTASSARRRTSSRPARPTLEVYWTLYNAGDRPVDGPFAALRDTGGEIETWRRRAASSASASRRSPSATSGRPRSSTTSSRAPASPTACCRATTTPTAQLGVPHRRRLDRPLRHRRTSSTSCGPRVLRPPRSDGRRHQRGSLHRRARRRRRRRELPRRRRGRPRAIVGAVDARPAARRRPARGSACSSTATATARSAPTTRSRATSTSTPTARFAGRVVARALPGARRRRSRSRARQAVGGRPLTSERRRSSIRAARADPPRLRGRRRRDRRRDPGRSPCSGDNPAAPDPALYSTYDRIAGRRAMRVLAGTAPRSTSATAPTSASRCRPAAPTALSRPAAPSGRSRPADLDPAAGDPVELG